MQSSRLPVSQPKPPVKVRSRKFNEQVIDSHVKKQTPNKGILGNGKTTEKVKLCMWNVNGIRSVLNKNVLNNFVSKYTPDIFCVNQTKINKDLYDKSPIYIKGYNGYWNFCKCSAGYSGVAIFSKFLPISIFEDMEQVAYSQEGRVITLQFEFFYVVAVYIPSAGGRQLERLYYKTQQYEVAFHKYCQKLRKNGKAVIVCGDMNVSAEEIDIHVTANTHKQPGFTPQERKSFRKFLQLGWVDTFRKLNPNKRQYTWWRIQHGNRERNIGKRLDYFLINQEHSSIVTKSCILGDVMGSDHCPVAIDIDLSKAIFKITNTEEKLEKKESGQSYLDESLSKVETAKQKIEKGPEVQYKQQQEETQNQKEKPQEVSQKQAKIRQQQNQSDQTLTEVNKLDQKTFNDAQI